MRRLVVLVLVVLAVVGPWSSGGATGTGGDAPSSPAGAGLVGFAEDRAGDVHVRPGPGVGVRARRTIDLRRLRVIDRGRVVRFAVDVRRVRRSDRFLQIFLVDLDGRDARYTQVLLATDTISGHGDRHGTEHSVTTQPTAGGSVTCDHLALSLRDGARRWWVEVPKRCLPSGRPEVEVLSQTTAPTSADSLVQYSSDRLRLGRLDVGGSIAR